MDRHVADNRLADEAAAAICFDFEVADNAARADFDMLDRVARQSHPFIRLVLWAGVTPNQLKSAIHRHVETSMMQLHHSPPDAIASSEHYHVWQLSPAGGALFMDPQPLARGSAQRMKRQEGDMVLKCRPEHHCQS